MGAAQHPSISQDTYIKLIRQRFEEEGDPTTAEGQMAYMKHRFAYFGLKAPEWVAIAKDVMAEHGFYTGDGLKEFVRGCFDEECREMHYVGLQMLEKQVKTLQPGDIDFLEECALNQSWWDTVDWVNKLVGIHFKRFPDLQHPTAEKWIRSDVIWLQRLAMIHQLTFKEKADFNLMKRMILHRAQSKEFFVQKAAGWALRQHFRVDPDGVTAFVEEHAEILSSLTKREALKNLGKKN